MTWPWVSRRRLDYSVYGLTQRLDGALSRCAELTAELERAAGMVHALERSVQIEQALRRDEQWRRIKAQGQIAYMQDRVKRVLGLPGFADEEEKKTA